MARKQRERKVQEVPGTFKSLAALNEKLGLTSGRLTITTHDHSRNGRHYYECTCTCGGTIVVRLDNLDLKDTGNSAKTLSCGCQKKENMVKTFKKAVLNQQG